MRRFRLSAAEEGKRKAVSPIGRDAPSIFLRLRISAPEPEYRACEYDRKQQRTAS
jgi:hypothetical protein